MVTFVVCMFFPAAYSLAIFIFMLPGMGRFTYQVRVMNFSQWYEYLLYVQLCVVGNNAHKLMATSLCVSDKDRQTVFISLTIISLVGNFLFFLIQRTETEIAPSGRSESPLPAEASESDSVVMLVC